MTVTLWIAMIFAAVFFLFLAPALITSYILYRIILVRTGPEKWARECSMPDDAEYKQMFDLGMDWARRYAECKSALSVTSDGLRLEGEYFDFGFSRAVIVIPGRMESLLYSYFFAEPYRQAGYNVLVIDNRAHGESEGRRCSLGVKESRDLLRWSALLHEKKGVEQIVFHGVCIGACSALYALVSPEAPEYLMGLVAEGMYPTFAESFKNHMIADHRPLFPFFWGAMLHIRVFSGANVVTDGPIRRIGKLNRPILFLHSREDIFSLPERAQTLYDLCPAPKELVWFDTGAHSRIRINHREAYDDAILRFLMQFQSAEKEAET